MRSLTKKLSISFENLENSNLYTSPCWILRIYSIYIYIYICIPSYSSIYQPPRVQIISFRPFTPFQSKLPIWASLSLTLHFILSFVSLFSPYLDNDSWVFFYKAASFLCALSGRVTKFRQDAQESFCWSPVILHCPSPGLNTDIWLSGKEFPLLLTRETNGLNCNMRNIN